MQTESKPDKYWGNLEPYSEDFAKEVCDRFTKHMERMAEDDTVDRIMRSWCQYHSRAEDGKSDASVIRTEGEKGVNIRVSLGEYRNAIRTKLNLVTGQPLTFQATSLNDDSEAVSATLKSQTVLKHYEQRGGLGVGRKQLAEEAEVMTSAWLLVLWDEMAGDPVEFNPVSKQWKFEGDLTFPVCHHFQCAYDTASADITDPNWLIVQRRTNRYELAKRYPKYKRQILECGHEAKKHPAGERISCLFEDHEDYIRPFYVWFKPSVLNPVGRMAIVLDAETVIFDGDSPYSRVPGVMMRSSQVMGESGMAYGDDLDMLPACELLQDAQSTLQTRAAQGMTLVWTAAGKYELVQMQPFGRLQGGTQKPESIELFSIKQEMFQNIQYLLGTIHRLGFINDALMGDANAADSGSKLAFQVSTGMQNQQGFKTELNRVMEVAATLAIEVLQTHMSEARVVSIVGKRNVAETARFTKEELRLVNKVLVKVADPLMDTPEGRRQAADLAAQKGWVKNMNEWVTTYLTGATEVTTGDETDQTVLIKRENELMSEGRFNEIEAHGPDQHLQHFVEHSKLFLDDRVRMNPALADQISQHCALHLQFLTPGSALFSPEILLATGQQPLPATAPGTGPGGGARLPQEMQPPGAMGAPEQPQGSPPKETGMSGRAPVTRPPNMPNGPKGVVSGQPVPTPALDGAPTPPGATP